MTNVELKNILIHRIAAINDKSFLNAIKTIIETKSESTVYKTTPEQQQRIMESRKQIARGEYFTNEDVEMEIDQWLSAGGELHSPSPANKVKGLPIPDKPFLQIFYKKILNDCYSLTLRHIMKRAL